MVLVNSCDCNERVGTEINSLNLFKELKAFFEEQVGRHIFSDVKVERPYYVWINGNRTVKHYATKWYKCNACGCLWEFEYPDFPAKGFVKKYDNGVYTGTYIVDVNE